ncbi:ABC transporter permease [Rugosimonospora africana]|uniref:Membrane protein n=1 Tax=Rugosimonospora africana TaxID=556532 RepID=A0A8J3VP94_9ACTN|nr:FtsX-like permease family protein [Rugosimonospora africana]GIH13048.1 membrane protein [Rugosimonospora africana]
MTPGGTQPELGFGGGEHPPRFPSRWTRDLTLGARLAFAGGREGWLRTALTAIGIGLGVVLLLGCAAVPNILRAHTGRVAARADDFSFATTDLPRGDATLLVADIDTRYREWNIRGQLLQPEGPRAPLPPGLSALPGPGQLVVSPALARLLDSPDGALLRPRFEYPVVGTIGEAGLLGPNEYAFYLGSDQLEEVSRGPIGRRIDHFGAVHASQPLSPMLILLVLIIFVVLLLPVVVFVATAVRFGGEHRDRRLAALRLVGADGAMTRRVAAGEGLLGAALGVGLGIVGFLVAREFAGVVTLYDQSVYPADVRPSLALGLLVVLAVPAVAVGVNLLALRRVVIEPLGVVRQAAGTRRRLWWRLTLPVLGVAALYPLSPGTDLRDGTVAQIQVTTGAILLLLGVAALLPWLIEVVVARLGTGSVPWQLAMRRLQLGGGTSARAVVGVAVAAAGAVALQMLFGAAARANTVSTGQDPSRIQVEVSLIGQDSAQEVTLLHRLLATPGVTSGYGMTHFSIVDPAQLKPHSQGSQPGIWDLTVADCASLRQMLVIDECADGDVFQASPTGAPDPTDPHPGERVLIGDPDQPNAPHWTIPATARAVRSATDASGLTYTGLMATPGAISGSALPRPGIVVDLRADDDDPDAIERVRNTAAGVDPLADVTSLRATAENHNFAVIRRGLAIGALATLLLVGASLLVGTLEQLRERRRLLAVLVAFGTKRTTLSRSVLWQTAIPVLLAMALAVLAGVGLGAILLRMVHEPVRMDWSGIGLITAAAGLVVLLVTGLSLPLLYRLMRPDGLRTE